MPLDLDETGIEQAPWVVGDVETTGLVSEKHQVVEVCLLRFEVIGGKRTLTSKISTLVRPSDPIDEMSRAYQANKISNEMLAGHKGWGAVASDVADIVKGAVLITHKLFFDADFIRQEQLRARYPWPIEAGLCSLALSKRYKSQLVAAGFTSKSSSLQELIKGLDPTPQEVAKSFDCSPTLDAHRAEADAWAVYALWVSHLLPYMVLGRDVSVSDAMFYSGISLQ